MDQTVTTQGEDFVEIGAGRDVFSKDYAKLKRVALPIQIHQPDADWRDVPLAMILLVACLSGLVRAAQFPVLAIVALCAGAFAGLLIARIIARRELGAGLVSIEAAGFSDSRIGPDVIPWSACERCASISERMGRQTPGVYLFMRPGAALPHVSGLYRRAFSIWRRTERQVLYLELKGAGYTTDLVSVVRCLVKKHGGSA